MAKPFCVYFGVCGGCSLQDVDYEWQVGDKRKAVSEATGAPDVAVFCGSEYGYRNRMDFVFLREGLGFRRKGGWRDSFKVEECPICKPQINGLLNELNGFFKSVDAFDPQAISGTFKSAVIRASDHGTSVSIAINEESPRADESVSRVREYSRSSSASNVSVAYVPAQRSDTLSQKFNTLKGGEFLAEDYLGKRFDYHIQGFFQNNPLVAGKMQAYVKGLFGHHRTAGAQLLDLYGGVGTFGITNAGLFGQVAIVESDAGAIKASEMNIARNSAHNVSSVALDARRLREVDLKVPLYVITDPPRGGMHPKTIKRLNELKPEAIVYISCNVRQLAADIPKFEGYAVKSAALFDMFPQTPHAEAIAELVPA